MTAKNVEDVYELTPLQHGILFHCLSAPDSGVYVEQAYLTLAGDLDRDAFWRAWQTVIDRHPALRATFHWDGINKPVQAVHRSVGLTRHEVDWRGVPRAEQDERLEQFLLEERRRGFDLERPPLLNITLFRLADGRHWFAWRICHLIADGWSFGVILGEFIALYKDYFHGRQPVLSAPGDFRHYVGWWKAQDGLAAEAYWRDYLAGVEVPPPLNLGGAEDVATGDVPYERRELSLASIADELRAFSAEHRLTLHTLVQGAWMLVLSRCQRDHEVIVGATMAHRPGDLPNGESIVGPMVVTLPIRSNVDPDAPLLVWLRGVQDGIVAARDHAGAPLTDIRGWAPVPRSKDLFESIVSFENVPIPEISFADEGLELVDYTFDGRPQYPLSFVVLPGDDLPLRLIYDRRRFRGAAVARMLDRVQQVLRAVLADPDRSVGEIDILTAAEHDRLREWSAPRALTPVRAGLGELVAQHAAARPDAVALSGGPDPVALSGGAGPTAPGGSGSLTYRELDEQSNQLAGHLAEQFRVGPGSRVAICADRVPRTVVSMLAVLKTGAAFVPLDPSHPPERLAFTVADSAATVVLADASTLEAVGGPGSVPVLRLDEVWAEVTARSAVALPVVVAPDDEAYVVYTSGSTGTPKGVSMTHANVIRLVRSMDKVLDVGPDDVWTCLHTFAFDASVWEIWGALLNGSRLVVVPRWIARSADACYELLLDERVTVALYTPRAFEQLIAAESLLDQQVRDRLALRYVLVGADRVEPTALRPWFERHGDQHPPVFNVYGPTETTVFCTHHRITLDEVRAPVAPNNIGRPVADTVFHLLDDRLRPVPLGVPGEIHIATPGMGRGYLNLPELTAERFVPDPFTGGPDALMYRTGDLARYDDDGDVEFLGRIDNQVKIRGFRVELGEIEAVLRSDPGVRNAAAVLREDVPGDQRLVAYVTPEDAGRPPAEAGLRELMRRRLPEYMLPATLMTLADIPLSANGKLDATLLPTPERSAPVAAPRVAPRTDTELHLARLMGELLAVDVVGVEDNLVDLGLHSLLATGVVARIRDEWRVPVPLRALFETPTVAALGRLIESGGSNSGLADRPGQVDLPAEVTLAPEIRVSGPAPAPVVARMLLTGATGFLGGTLLAGLLRSTPGEVVCLVRAGSVADGEARVVANLRAQGMWDEGFAGRIVALPGSLGAPCLGLGEEGFAALGEEIDEIHHCGALVNFLQPYRRLRGTNVGGTQEVLRLATLGRVKPMHYVSTGAVLGQLDDSGAGVAVAREERLGAHPPLLSGGYAQSKWVAESIVSLAADRGVPVTIHRSGRITGHSRTATWSTGDATSEMLRACVNLGMVPALEGVIDMTPVDFVADAVAALARTNGAAGRVFHLTNPVPVTVDTLVGGIELAGHPVRTVSVSDWYAALIRLAREDRDQDWTVALALLGTWVHNYLNGRREPTYECTATLAALDGVLRCPPVNEQLIARYVQRFQDTGYVPAPSEHPRERQGAADPAQSRT